MAGFYAVCYLKIQEVLLEKGLCNSYRCWVLAFCLSRCFSVSRALEQTHSLPSFGLCVGLCDLAMCVTVVWSHIQLRIKYCNS
jgi:hypothetical protein